ncbi:sirohydrochlorin cobaltochelatase [Marinomonas gallaica]|uniref:Sirohydrochlorin cobaltochelatase n=1 Tax=Marinomonas gallaica TaxID=1806667 RepID=A0A1C3JU78_9GAMM|nr:MULTISPECIES: CbiX/SirB N-terminal domain-containing protein [Marinomonas]SBT18798.1 sirohydrochlorin cobaltochelatase [Marinomonas gallaica]SBT21753.1 sirohydrochlorin cobaltochelatase [Marinomonas gallaica]
MQLEQYDHIILLAHGSSDPRWKIPFEQLLARVTGVVSEDKVTLAYMELCKPSIEDVLAILPPETANIAVFPLFFAQGRHLRVDVPKQLEELNTEQRTLTLLNPIGDDPEVVSAMEKAITSKLTDD